MSVVDELQTKCLSHSDGKHCWHQNGRMGFSGRFQSSVRVVCCHCKAHGRQYFDVRPNGYVEMRDGPLPQSETEAKPPVQYMCVCEVGDCHKGRLKSNEYCYDDRERAGLAQETEAKS